MSLKKRFFIFLLFLFSNNTVLMAADYVGNKVCINCHAKEHQQWQGSHHELAMQLANEKSVLGDFNQVTFTKGKLSTTFFKKNGRFMVNTEGADGQMQDFEIAYTFGVYPLQQYMVMFPQGKIQVLDIAWDSRTKEQGGQRWFSLHPNETIKAGDVLHWTGPNLNWNYMCSDCHSTGLKKNYNPKTRSYDTQWQEINVSCEACHGPASGHLQWAQLSEEEKLKQPHGLSIDFSSISKRHWLINKETGKPELQEENNRNEVELCAQCHSRRAQLNDTFIPGDNFRDHYLPSLLSPGLYHPDGKIDDEVYVYGSFKQSRMYQAGVTCSDCHNAHTLKIKGSVQEKNDSVCLQCHANEQYASTKHHFHQPDSEGSRCIACHMPAKTYMGVDERNDHSFRIPRPDTAHQFGLPDACSNCHTDKNNQWAADALKEWTGARPESVQEFAPALYSLDHQTYNALSLAYQLIISEAPDIAKATAAGYLGRYPSRQTLMTSLQMLRSPDTDSRRQALLALEEFPIQHTIRQIFPMLKDAQKMVRIEAARILSAVPRGAMEKSQSQLLDEVIEEYKQTLLFAADRPEAQLSLAHLYQNLGQVKQAEKAFKEALELQPQYVPAYINYAQFLRSQNDDSDAFKLLQKGLSQVDDATLHHSVGLWFIRHQKKEQGLKSLQKAAKMAPDNARFQYVYAVASAEKQPEQAIKILERSLKNHSGHLETLSALASYYKQMGNTVKAEEYYKRSQQVLSVKLPSVKKSTNKSTKE